MNNNYSIQNDDELSSDNLNINNITDMSLIEKDLSKAFAFSIMSIFTNTVCFAFLTVIFNVLIPVLNISSLTPVVFSPLSPIVIIAGLICPLIFSNLSKNILTKYQNTQFNNEKLFKKINLINKILTAKTVVYIIFSVFTSIGFLMIYGFLSFLGSFGLGSVL